MPQTRATQRQDMVPDDDESREDFMDRCTDEMDEDVCSDIWDNRSAKKGVIRKTHADDQSVGMDFVMSDATPDRYDDVIEPTGWILENFQKNPIALFGHNSSFPIGKWSDLRIENNALRGRLRMAPEGTSSRIDELRRLIDAGILRAVSVGFIPVEMEEREGSKYGTRFIKQDLVETSLVSVPANPNALAVAKGLKVSREIIDAVFVRHGERTRSIARGVSGEHAERNVNQKASTMTPIGKRIEDTQTRLNTLRDQLDTHSERMLNSENVDDATRAIVDTLTAQIDAEEKNLESFKKIEGALASRAAATSLVPVSIDRGSGDNRISGHDRNRHDENPVNQSVRVFAAPAEKISPAGYLWKALAVAVKAQSDQNQKRDILDILKETYGESTSSEPIRMVMSRMITKAASAPADLVTPGWADTLVQTVIGDFIQSLIPHSIYPGLAAKGGSFTFGRNGVISLPARNTAATVGGAFIAQGAPIPVKQGAFVPLQLTPKKMGVITTLTREITEHSTPAIEGIIRQAMLEDTGIAIDTVLLDANASTTIRPAGLKSGVTKTPPTAGGTLTAFVGDIRALAVALINGTKGNVRAPAWVMNPGDVLAASLLQTTVGDTPFREELAGGTLLGYPILSSVTGLNDMMVLVDAADFITATGDTPNFSVSDQAVLHMEDTTPLQLGTAGTPPTIAAPARSLWQTDTMAIRMIMDINWAMRRAGVVAWTDTMTWN